ncbi:MAG: glycine cleavage system aminomethyltransferase GcvT [Pseudomonadota bacterium]
MSDEATQTLPLDAWHRDKGARMVPFAGYAMAIQYEGIMAEHQWTRENAGLFDVSHMGQLQLKGEGAAEALERIVPGDISALKPGKMRYSLLLAEDGGILDDMMITNTGQNLYIVVNGAVKHQDIAYMRAQLPESIELVHMEDQALLALQGPKAAEALAQLGITGREAGWPGPDDLYFMDAAPCLWGEVPLGISRSGYTGEDGFEISVPAEHVTALADALCKQSEVKPIGLGARDSLRLEAGLPLYGHDLDPAIDPVQGNLTFAISKARRNASGFHGSDRILAALENGPDKKRVGFAVEGRMPVREGASIFAGDIEIGVITSGGFAPTIGAPIAMGFVAADHAALDTQLEAEVRGKRVPITVTKMPFVPNGYRRKGKS